MWFLRLINNFFMWAHFTTGFRVRIVSLKSIIYSTNLATLQEIDELRRILFILARVGSVNAEDNISFLSD